MFFINGTGNSTSQATEQSKIVDVNGNGDYLSIQEAIDAGSKNLFVRNGTYNITSTITLIGGSYSIIGEDKYLTKLVFASNIDGIRIYSNYNTIKNITLDSETNDSTGASVVIGDGLSAGTPNHNIGCYNTISDCIIKGSSNIFALYLSGASYTAGNQTLTAFEENELQAGNVVDNCIMTSTYAGDAFVFALQRDGQINNNDCVGRIAFYMTRNCKCNNNNSNDSINNGINIGGPSYDNEIAGNIINNPTETGIHLQNRIEHLPLLTGQCIKNNLISNNIIHDSANMGIALVGDENFGVQSNIIINNIIVSCNNHAIYLQDAQSNTISNNNITNPGMDVVTYTRASGIYMVNRCTDNTIIGNTIIDERVPHKVHTGIANREDTTSTGNKISENIIRCNNTERTIWIQSSDTVITSNVVEGGYYAGIYLDGADNCVVSNNKCKNNTNEANNTYPEIWLKNTATSNVIHGNYCISTADNKASIDIVIEAGSSAWSNNNSILGVLSKYTDDTDTSLSLKYDKTGGPLTGDVVINKNASNLKLNWLMNTSYGGLDFTENGAYKGTVSCVGSNSANASRRNDVTIESASGGIDFMVSGASKLKLFTDGALGLGVTTKKDWYSLETSFQVGGSFVIGSTIAESAGGQSYVGNNAYRSTSGTWKRKFDDKSTLIAQAGGAMTVYTADTGAADGNLTLVQNFKVDSNGIMFGSTTTNQFYTSAGNALNGQWGLDTDSGSMWLNYHGYQGGSTRFRNLAIGNGKTVEMALFNGSANTCKFSCNVGIGATPITKFQTNVGTNQNLGIQSSSGVTNLTAFNDAGDGFVPLKLTASKFNFASPNLADVSGTSSIFLYSTDSMAINKGGNITFGGSYTGTTETSFAGISGRKENATDTNIAGYLALSTSQNGVGFVERMRITSLGNVGVSCIPLSKFQVNVGTDLNIGIQSSSSVANLSAFNDTGELPIPLKITGSTIELLGDTTVTGDLTIDGGLTVTDPLMLEQLATKAYTDAISIQAGYTSFMRQSFVDGNFQVAQILNNVYNTEITNPATATNPVFDMWRVYFNADGGTLPTIKHSQNLLTPGELYNSKFSYRINVNGTGTSFGANSTYYIANFIENGTSKLCGDGKQVTVSFWAKSSIVGKSIGMRLQQNYGTGGSPTSAEIINGQVFALTDYFVKYSYTFTTNTLASKTFGTNNDDYLMFQLFYMWGTNIATTVGDSTSENFVGSGDIDIAQIQISAGSVALPFELKSFNEELIDCQRYLRPLDFTQRITEYDANRIFASIAIGEMRIKPVMIDISATYGTDWGVINIQGASVTGFAPSFHSNSSNRQVYFLATKTSHGLTDASIVSRSKIFADARF